MALEARTQPSLTPTIGARRKKKAPGLYLVAWGPSATKKGTFWVDAELWTTEENCYFFALESQNSGLTNKHDCRPDCTTQSASNAGISNNLVFHEAQLALFRHPTANLTTISPDKGGAVQIIELLLIRSPRFRDTKVRLEVQFYKDMPYLHFAGFWVEGNNFP